MPQANVKATDAILAVKAAVLNFSKQTTDGLAEIDAEVRRTIDWLEHDRPAYWRERVRRAQDEVTQAKVELQRCLTFQASESHRPSCTEQKAALLKAQQRLRYCQEKQERVKHWRREAAHEMHEFQGRLTALATAADQDAPQAAALLDRVLRAVDAYASGSVGGSTGTGTVEKPDDDATSQDTTNE